MELFSRPTAYNKGSMDVYRITFSVIITMTVLGWTCVALGKTVNGVGEFQFGSDITENQILCNRARKSRTRMPSEMPKVKSLGRQIGKFDTDNGDS